MADGQRLGGLDKVNHIVVVMMENRSFDHMLGYLKNDGLGDIEGLTSAEVNFNFGRDGRRIPITPFDADATAIQRHGEALQKRLDPDHSPEGVAIQLSHGYKDRLSGRPYGEFAMGGFVQAFVESRRPEDGVGEDLWMVPMGYYTGKDLPVYDFLARAFCVCDHWHSSIPGDTWPNRQYAIAGRAAEKAKPGWLEQLAEKLGPLKALRDAPIYDVPAFTRHLEDRQWRWYSHDPASLRAVDSHYRDLHEIRRENFSYFDRTKVAPTTQAGESVIVGHDSFLDDAAKGELRDVSWIDPNFIDLSVLDPNSNDDHPPSDIRAGQAFILELYEALSRGPNWDDTMLVIVYDEHGGFYDHVHPPSVDDGSGYETFGVRVPAIVAGPRVQQFVCHDALDHTALIKTILTRFAPNPDEAIRRMGARVAASPDLRAVLQAADAPRPIPEPTAAQDAIREWRERSRDAHRASAGGAPSAAPDGAGQPLVLHEFQQDFAKFALALRHRGLPPGQP